MPVLRGWKWMICVLLLLIVCAPVCAAADHPAGEVLFSAAYADYGSLRDTGLSFGTSSWERASAKLEKDGLAVCSASDQKTYLLLPREIEGTDTYTIEFTFRFTDVLAANGYCGVILTSSGDAPSNRTELILRAGGACDDLGQFGEKLSAALADGQSASVVVPIRHGMLSEVTVKCGGVSETLKTSRVRAISEGRRGFVFRNASVLLESVRIVSGVDYEALTGVYADKSYVAPADYQWDGRQSPRTADAAVLPITLIFTFGTLAALVRRRRAV